MVYRVYVEKRKELSHEAKALLSDARAFLGIEALRDVRIINRYDAENISPELFDYAIKTVFSEPQLDIASDEVELDGARVFAVEYLPGQFDQRADSAAQCIQIISQGERPLIRTAKLYALYGELSDEELAQIKKYVINPVEAREASLEKPATLAVSYDIPTAVRTLEGFIELDRKGLEAFVSEYALAMDLDDIAFCQEYFRSEKRDPTITEIRMIDTYWSDHCRHTTFLTEIDGVSFEDELLQSAYEEYLKVRRSLGRNKPICLMDIATIAVKKLRADGLLDKLDESEEINACTVKINVEVDGVSEPWLLLFKNETHNHPTEIEPFGGAATCIGGAIRDPLSGRSYVYGAMRVTGAADPLKPISETIKGKLPQRKIVTTAAAGYSSYGNQIGLATGFVQEVYHPNYVAKRLETGFVVAQNREENVVRSRPQKGDVVILLGGATGRDGCGGATGSSKSHNLKSVETCGAEVQKGNATTERKIQRLFKNPEVSKLIKKCNDFGAGGVSVAIGELADSIDIYLEKVPKKYEGLSGTELAISESQERMAVVIDRANLDRFVSLCGEENLAATNVAEITDTGRLRMFFKGEAIVDIERSFLDTNGVKQKNDVVIKENRCSFFDTLDDAVVKALEKDDYKAALAAELGRLNVCSQKGMVETFDSTIGARSVLLPYGGTMQETPSIVMAAKLGEDTSDTASVAAFGFNPHLTENSPFVGSMYAVLTSVSKLAAAGVNRKDIYLSLQEFFKRLGGDPERFGQPVSALLGAFEAQKGLGIAAIGGKDSMSGTFENIDVPPTLISFAIGTAKCADITDNVLRGSGRRLYLLPVRHDEYYTPDWKYALALYDKVNENILSGNVKYATVTEDGGAYAAVTKSVFGNGVGVDFVKNADFFRPMYGDIIVDAADESLLDGIDKILLGVTNSDGKVRVGGEEIAAGDLLAAYKGRLEEVYPTTAPAAGKAENLSYSAGSRASAAHVAKPRVFIPVFPGNNCEYDTARQFEIAGGVTSSFVLKNLTSKDINDSVKVIARAIDDCQILAIPGGFSGADEPDGSGKFIATVFSNPYIKESIENLLNKRDGLILGICNGFQALIKLGLVPNGSISPLKEDSPTLTFNNIGRHISKVAKIRVASNLSPWFSNVKVGEVYDVAISHGEGRFVCDEKWLDRLVKNGQIATQYVDFDGNATMASPYNPNGSVYSVEGITSADGRVLGKMGHSERIGDNLYKNVDGNYDMRLFAAGVDYFRK